MKTMKTIKLPCFGIIVNLTGDGGGAISSDMKDEWTEDTPEEDEELQIWHNCAIDGLESVILGHACAGIDIETPAYIEGIETAVQAIANNFSD